MQLEQEGLPETFDLDLKYSSEHYIVDSSPVHHRVKCKDKNHVYTHI